MRDERVDISTLRLDPSNVRRHPGRNLDAIAAALAKFGQQKRIVVDKDGVVYAGNGTVLAAKALGWTAIDVAISDLAGPELAAYAVADNRASELGEWDQLLLSEQLAGFDDELLAATGFDGSDLDAMLSGLAYDDETPAEPDVDPAKASARIDPKERKAKVKVVLTVDQVAVCERAIRATGVKCRGDAMAEICLAYLGEDTVE
jgi:ParB-like chromosome segregation protein Spo0J